MIDFKFTDLPLYSKFTSELNLLAVCTNSVADERGSQFLLLREILSFPY